MNPYEPPGAPPVTYPTGKASYVEAGSGVVNESSVELLRQTRPWVVVMSVTAFAASGFMVLIGIVASLWAAFAPSAKGTHAALGLVYLPIALLYVYPGVKLWSFAAAIGRLTSSRSAVDMDDALAQQKSFWKFSGIMALVLLGVYAIGFVAVIAVGALSAGLGRLGQ